MVSVAIFNFWIANMNNVSWTNPVNYLGVVVTVYGLADAVACFCAFLFYTRALKKKTWIVVTVAGLIIDCMWGASGYLVKDIECII